ncbi:hypothetical protein ACULNC_12940 [Shigella flexneri]
MFAGRLENLTPPHNPLDVLAQQTVAAAAMDALQVSEWYSPYAVPHRGKIAQTCF